MRVGTLFLACAVWANALLSAQAGGVSAAFSTQIFLQAPSQNDLCLSQALGSTSNISIRVICSGSSFVNIGPTPGVLVLGTFSSGPSTFRSNFGPGSATPSPWAEFSLGGPAPVADVGTVTFFGVSNFSTNQKINLPSGTPPTKEGAISSGDERVTEFLVSF